MGMLGDLSPAGRVAVGIFVGLASTSIQSVGLTLQRKSHMLEDEKDLQDTRRPPYRRRRWQIGMLMFVVSNIVGSTIQMVALPLPVLSTLQASGLVFNSICASLILGEPFTRWSLGGTILVSGGAILIALFGAIPEPAHDLNQLLELLNERDFIIWMIGQAILVLAIIASGRLVKHLYPHSSNSPRFKLFRGMSYGCVSGILSAHSLLVAKSAVELLIRTIVDHVNQFNRWQSWVILIGLVTLALSQLYFLHRGLKLCSTSILYPFVFCIYNIIAILDGLIYFQQTSKLSLLAALLIALGTLILLSGVICLSWRLNNDAVGPRPASAQTPLTPGMGIIPSEEDSNNEDSLLLNPHSDEEAQHLLPRRSPSIPAEFDSGFQSSPGNNGFPDYGAVKSKRRRTVGFRESSDLLSPISDGNRLSVTRQRRSAIEANEIWDELEEDNVSPLLSPMANRRRSSARSIPTRLRPLSASSDPASREPTTTDEVDEQRIGLLSRSETGRHYRNRLRTRSMPTAPGGRRRANSVEPGRTGPWPWERVKRWWIGDGSDKGKGVADERGRDDPI